MASAAQAIEKMAEATGLLPNTVFRVARYLREAGGDLWPQGSQGRGQEAHVEPHHLVNLVLVLGSEGLPETPKEAIDRSMLVQAELRVTQMKPL